MAALATPKPPSAPAVAAGARPCASVDHSAEIALVAAVALAAFGHLMIKYGLNTAAISGKASLVARLQTYLFVPYIFSGLAIYGCGTLLWIVAVAKRDVSYLYPVTALNYVLITIGGMWLFNEAVSPSRWLGILTVMCGVALMHASAAGRKP